MKLSIPTEDAKSDTKEYQQLTKTTPPVKRGSRSGSHHAAHEFRWMATKDGGTAWCTCGPWRLWGASLESARRSHEYHRRNRLVPSAKDAQEAC